MRPSSLRRFGIAVAGGLLLASGTVPTFGDDGIQTARPAGIAPVWDGLVLSGVGPAAAGTVVVDLVQRACAMWRSVWRGNKVFVPAGIIVDDGAPF